MHTMSMIHRQALLLFIAAFISQVHVHVHAFSSTLFQEQVSQSQHVTAKTVPTVQPSSGTNTNTNAQDHVKVELPDFEELFVRIKGTSPLARVAMQGGQLNGKRGLEALHSAPLDDNLPWKTVEKNPKRLVHSIEKIDNFQGLSAPLLRFRSSLKGPCLSHIFANFMTTTHYRSMWDDSLDQVYERYPIHDLEAVNSRLNKDEYGQCSKIGVGYCTTKPSFGVVDSREQLTMCGIQEYHDDGSAIIWGTEMQDHHNHLLPDDMERRTRAKSHLFATTLIPTSHNTFDVEYVIQLDIGGKIPTWLTTPIVIDNVKTMFQVVHEYFGEGEGGALDQYLKEQHNEALADKYSLLLTP